MFNLKLKKTTFRNLPKDTILVSICDKTSCYPANLKEVYKRIGDYLREKNNCL